MTAFWITSDMVDRALNAWFASPPIETDQGLERSMRAALEAALGLLARKAAEQYAANLSLVGGLRQYSIDLRRNSSGSDNYPSDLMRGVAEEIDRLCSTRPPSPAQAATVSEFKNELGNTIRITIEGPKSKSWRART